MNPKNDENTILIHGFISTPFKEHIGKVSNGDHSPFKPKDTKVKDTNGHDSVTNFRNNCSSEGQNVTGDESKTPGTETSLVVKTKDLGGRTDADPWAQELGRNNVRERVKESGHNVGKVNPGQRNSFMNLGFVLCLSQLSDVMD